MAKKKKALAAQRRQTHTYVKRSLILMVFIKSMGNLLAQIGLLFAGNNTVFLMIATPTLIFAVGYLLIKKFVTEELAIRIEKLIPIFYLFLVLACVGNVASFLKNVGFF